MTRWLRNASTRTLLVVASLAVLLPGGAAIAASSIEAPPPVELKQEADNLDQAPQAPGMVGRVQFKNNLLGSLPGTSDPMLTGGTGRIWVDSKGRMKAELQSDGGGGDAQILLTQKELLVWHASGNTLYRMKWDSGKKKEQKSSRKNKAQYKNGEDWLAKLQAEWNFSDPKPTVAAGRPAYELKATPKEETGQISGLGITWDAQYKIPLAVRVWAKGGDDPVLEVAATEAEFVAPESGMFQLATPPGAKQVNLSERQGKKAAKGKKKAQKISLDGARKKSGIALPQTLEGQSFSGAVHNKEGLLVSYGEDLNGWVIMIGKPEAKTDSASAELMETVSIGGAQAKALFTPLGGTIRWQSGNQTIALLGSHSRQEMLDAAQQIAQ